MGANGLKGHYETGEPRYANYDITGEGSQFIIVKSNTASLPTNLVAVINWSEELKRPVPAGK